MNGDLTDRIVVFAGPSVPSALRPADPLFAWLPPAAAGDAVRLRDCRPRTVVLIDGLFDTTPAIRHKELLNLLAAGIPLVGGASMGALRAAELHAFGMVGVGRIFQAFAEGRLIGDDEVALMHGPAEWDWTPLTEALVNVRATIQAALRARVISRDAGRSVIALARAVFYKERTWPALLRVLADQSPPSRQWVADLTDWLPAGRVDLKQADALMCLDVARKQDASGASTPMSETLFSMALTRAMLGERRSDIDEDTPRTVTNPPPDVG